MLFGSKKKETSNGAAAGNGQALGAAGTASLAQALEEQVTPVPVAASAPAAGAADKDPQELDPEVLAKIAGIRTKLHETFGKVAMAMMAIPRYRNLSIGDMTHLVLEPLMRDRIAIATSAKDGEPMEGTLSGIAIWASVSEDVDAKIREQIKAGIFPVRLKPDEWNSGPINWLLDVIAPNQRLTTAVIANFRQVLPKAVEGESVGDMRIHPIVTRLLDPEALKKMGASPIKANAQI